MKAMHILPLAGRNLSRQLTKKDAERAEEMENS